MNVTYKECKKRMDLRLFNKPTPTKGLRGLSQQFKKNLMLLKIIVRQAECEIEKKQDMLKNMRI
jgi:hypothetical protein